MDGKKRSKIKWSKYNSRRQPPSHTVLAEGAISIPKAEYFRVKIEKIRLRPEQSMTDEDVVSSIAEGFIVTGQIHPVIVRPVGLGKYALIWGADVLAAAQFAGVKRIECRLFIGSDEEARLLQIAESLFRKKLTALEKAEHWTDWAKTVLKAKGLFSGQPVPKKGRPEGDLLKSARLLPAYGRTVDTRKKMLARAFKIARLPSDVKSAVKDAGLDDNQSALLAIASAGGAEAQHRKLAQLLKKLAEVPEVQSPPLQPAEAPTTSDDEGSESNDTDSDAQKDRAGKDDDDEVSADDDGQREEAYEKGDEGGSEDDKSVLETDFRQLRKFWKDQGGIKLWARTPMTVRKEFVNWLESRPCRASSDVGRYVRDVFAGRKNIEISVLKAHSISKGLSWKSLRKYFKANGYRRKKHGGDPRALQTYENRDPDFSGCSSITEKELQAPRHAELDVQSRLESQRTPTNLSNKADDYYEL
ncbi:MAG: ParB N-terminal domain-containing protein [Pseudorhodoplanes sp.]|jgi:ParB family chromosome partitioning protein|nr:ParB N-terminal domain-containing protein [Pseudorhodoplanes sp.]